MSVVRLNIRSYGSGLPRSKHTCPVSCGLFFVHYRHITTCTMTRCSPRCSVPVSCPCSCWAVSNALPPPCARSRSACRRRWRSRSPRPWRPSIRRPRSGSAGPRPSIRRPRSGSAGRRHSIRRPRSGSAGRRHKSWLCKVVPVASLVPNSWPRHRLCGFVRPCCTTGGGNVCLFQGRHAGMKIIDCC